MRTTLNSNEINRGDAMTYCIEYTSGGKVKYVEISATSKQEAIKILIQKTNLTEFEYAIWKK